MSTHMGLVGAAPVAGHPENETVFQRPAEARVGLEVALMAVVGLVLLAALAWVAGRNATPAWAHTIEAEGDHVTLEGFTDAILRDPAKVTVIDVRPASEFAEWHLPGSVNLALPELLGAAGAKVLERAQGNLVVLVSNGMVHPAQAWVELTRRGHSQVKVLEGGLTDFKRNVLTPPSLRGPVSQQFAAAENGRFRAITSWFQSASMGAGAAAGEGKP